MYEFISKGLCETVGPPACGQQDRGVSPGGAMDLFALQTGNILLDNPVDEPALEMIIAPEIRFIRTCCFVLTGAGYDTVRLISEDTERPVAHGKVFRADAGSVLKFGNRTYGFRSYLCSRLATGCEKNITGRVRGAYVELAEWSAADNTVRIMEGPEYPYVEHPEYFVDSPWRVGNDLSRMGMRLECLREMPLVSLRNMISGPVANGTVQFTPGGPIILLRHRQTVGGYPRVFNVISADIDKLGQFAPGQIVRFRRATSREAGEIAKGRSDALRRFKNRFDRESR